MLNYTTNSCNKKSGFTMVEISVAVVIIGLIVGGIIIASDLIKSSGIRSIIAQIDGYKASINTFEAKYNALPGDISTTDAANFGFTSRSGARGWGDGSGIIEGGVGSDSWDWGIGSSSGELCLFWIDLGNAKFIEGNYTGGTADSTGGTPCILQYASVEGEDLNYYFPKAKIGTNNYVYIWSGGVHPTYAHATNADGTMFFSVANVTAASGGYVFPTEGLSVINAYNIDTKMALRSN